MTEQTPLFCKGTEFFNPENSSEGYRLTRDVFSTMPIMANQLEAIGNAPPVIAGQAIPAWLAPMLYPKRKTS